MQQDWTETREKLREKLAKLIEGGQAEFDELQARAIARLEAKLGQTREAILKLLNRL